MTSTQYGTITETDLTGAAFAVGLACNAGHSSTGTPTAVACGSAGDYTVTDACTDTDGCSGATCGTNAACADMAAPGTGYTCSCGAGYTGSDTTNTAATCIGALAQAVSCT